MGFVNQLSLECITSAFLFHYVDIKWFYQQTYFTSGFKTMVILYHQFVAFVSLYQHFIMYTFEDTTGYDTRQLCGIRWLEDIKVFRPQHHVYLCLFSKTFIHTFEFVSGKSDEFILYHHTVQYIAFTDKISIVDIYRSTDLLYLSFAHYDDGIT